MLVLERRRRNLESDLGDGLLDLKLRLRERHRDHESDRVSSPRLARRWYARFDVELPLDEGHAGRAIRLYLDRTKQVALRLVVADEKAVVFPVGVDDAGRTHWARGVILTFSQPAVAALEREARQSFPAIWVGGARAADSPALRLAPTVPASGQRAGHVKDQDHEEHTNDVRWRCHVVRSPEATLTAQAGSTNVPPTQISRTWRSPEVKAALLGIQPGGARGGVMRGGSGFSPEDVRVRATPGGHLKSPSVDGSKPATGRDSASIARHARGSQGSDRGPSRVRRSRRARAPA